MCVCFLLPRSCFYGGQGIIRSSLNLAIHHPCITACVSKWRPMKGIGYPFVVMAFADCGQFARDGLKVTSKSYCQLDDPCSCHAKC